MNRFKELLANKKLLCIAGGAVALLVVVGIVLAVVFGGAKSMDGCTIEVKTEGGMALNGIGVYVYTDTTLNEMVTFAKTDAEGKITVSQEIPAGSIAVLDGVPAGYAVAENYALTESAVQIVLKGQLLQEMSPISLGSIMFDFTVTDTEGTSYTLSELLKEKKAVVLNLWYTNCQPCKMEFPYLQQAYDAYSADVAVLAIDPVAEDSDAAISEFKTSNGLTLPMAKVDAKWAEQVANIAYPTTIVIDRYGMVALMHTGSVDNAKTFKDAFAFFAAEYYVQTTVDAISTLLTDDDETANQGGNEETTAPPETTVPPTSAPTEPEETQKPTTGSNSGSSGSSANYNGTLVNPEEPVEHYGYNDFTIEVGKGEKYLVNIMRVFNEATLCISDKDAYVVYKNKTYTPDASGNIYVRIKGQGTFTPIELEIGNSGASKKTFNVKFYFDKGTKENPGQLKTGNNVIECQKGNDQGAFYTFKASKRGTLTLTVVSISPSTVICGITISDMQQNTKVVELQEGEKTVSIELPADATAEIIFSTSDPDKASWKIPAADIKINVAFSELPAE